MRKECQHIGLFGFLTTQNGGGRTRW